MAKTDKYSVDVTGFPIENSEPESSENAEIMPGGGERVAPGEAQFTAKKRFPRDVTDADLELIPTRDSIGSHIFFRRIDDTFNKWMKIESDTEGLADQITENYKELKIKFNFKMAYKLALIGAWSLIVLNLDDASEGLETEPAGVKGIRSVTIIRKDQVDKVNYDEDPDSDTFSQPISYNIKISIGNVKKEYTVNAKRCIHWTNYGIDNDIFGMSMFLPLHDDFMGKKNIDYAIPEAVWQDAAMLNIMKLPKGAGKAAKEWAMANFKNLNVKSEIICPSPEWLIEKLSGNGGMNPSPAMKYTLDKIGSGSREGKTTMVGVQSGSVAGAQYNYRDYFSFISDEQTEKVQFYLEEYNAKLQEWGIFKPGNVTFDWNPLFETEETELAEVEKNRAESFERITNAVIAVQNSGNSLIVEDEGLYLALPGQGYGIKINLEVKALSTPIPELSPEIQTLMLQETENQDRPSVFLSKADERKFYNIWKHPTDQVTTVYNGQMMSATAKYSASWLTKFKVLWFSEGMEPGMNSLQNDEVSFMKTLIKLEGRDTEIEKVLNDMITAAFEAEGEKLTDLAEIEFSIDDPALRVYLDTHVITLKDDITTTLNKKYVRAIQDGIAAGEGYNAINDRLIGISSQYNEGMPNTVHKIVHSAQMHMRADALEKNREEYTIWLTVGDARVRPNHSALEGSNPHRISDVRNELDAWGCRCTLMPLSYYEKQQLGVA